MRARDLGVMGESGEAWKLLELAKESSQKINFKIKLVDITARVFGWKITGGFFKLINEALTNYRKYTRYGAK